MYLITGGAGFIGSNLTKKLLEDGNHVRILDDFSTGTPKNIHPLKEKYKTNLEIIEGSVCDRSTCKKALAKIKYISHHAAIPSVQQSIDHPLKTNTANVVGTLTLLEEARNVDGLEKLIFAASSSAYGDIESAKKIETLPPNPLSPYAAQKLLGEFYSLLYWKLFKVPTLAFRYFNIFGPNQNPDSPYSAAIPLFIRAFIQNKRPTIFGDGNQSRDFTHIDNVIDANIKGFTSKVNGEVINIACGTQQSLNNLIDELQLIFNKKIEPIFEPSRKGDVKHSLADISKAKKFLNYTPVTSFKEGLLKTVTAYKTVFK